MAYPDQEHMCFSEGRAPSGGTEINYAPVHLQLDAWLPELLEAKVAAHWRIPKSLKPASKVTGCATEFNAHQKIPNSLKPASKVTGCATEFNAHQRIPNSLKPVSKVTGCTTEFNAHQRLPAVPNTTGGLPVAVFQATS
ncbi:hypothetical protein LAZ67_4002735 [Cordylochernes scorpioides]|uniref:Uncharacterized protein n=1 Tax=Cordylochernes scorpioides TaxID=51811 RepID=A0ABY6KGG4_9ARAC|nr:hypothetical protein LAZ67_4002735 [Cordylochernes scorpioides]